MMLERERHCADSMRRFEMTIEWARMVARYAREGHDVRRMFSTDERLAAVELLARSGDEATAHLIRQVR